MVAYPNSWSGKRQFSKGKRAKLPTAKTDSGYKRYCKQEKKAGREPMNYRAWVWRERNTGSHMF